MAVVGVKAPGIKATGILDFILTRCQKMSILVIDTESEYWILCTLYRRVTQAELCTQDIKDLQMQNQSTWLRILSAVR
jgi:hypothetical protein